MALAYCTEKRPAFRYHAAMRNLDILPVIAEPSNLNWLARFGRAMNRKRKMIAVIQWCMVALYLTLLLVPMFLPHPGPDVRLTDNFALLSRFLLWGVGWPLILLSMMLFGRAWCGVFCPDGALTEFASRHGKNGYIPRWMRWPGWPFIMLAATAVWGQLTGVYGFAPASLLLLGLPTLGAILTGYLYGRGRRVWCMYLCPANGVMSLLAKIAPLHFRVDPDAWKRHPGPMPQIDCAPLINIRQMKSASACHACGRCAGYMDAVDLTARSPAAEILASGDKDVSRWEAITLLFGLLGVCTAAFAWKDSVLFAQMQALLASAFSGAQIMQTDAPWWLLANYPTAGTVYSLLDGISIMLFVLGGGMLLGLTVLAMLRLSVWLADCTISWQMLSLALIPGAGTGMVLGLSSLTLAMLRAEGMALDWVPPLQSIALAASCLFSFWLGLRVLLASPLRQPLRRLASILVYVLPIALLYSIWSIKLLG